MYEKIPQIFSSTIPVHYWTREHWNMGSISCNPNRG